MSPRIEQPSAPCAPREVAPGRDLAHASGRVAGLDAVRGVAVLVMVAWHGSEAWLSVAHRDGAAWSIARVAGGMAAPLFLFASGAAAELGASRGRPLSRAVERGLSLVALGFLLELERWAVDRGAALEPASWPALALGAGTGATVLLGARGLLPAALRRWRAALALALLAGHVASAWALEPALLAVTLRFDVLHCIGVCGVVVALLARALRGPCGALLLALGALAMVVVALPLGEALSAHEALAWVARAPSRRAIAPFPVLPWCAYATLGCALARAARLLAPRAPSRRLVLAATAVALAIAAVSFEGGLGSTRRAIDLWPALRPLARLAFHASAAVAIAGACAALHEARGVGSLRAIGAWSLAIYVLHVPLTYGVVTAAWWRALAPAECALAILAMLAACVAGAAIVGRATSSRATRAGGERAHMLARDIVSSPNLRA